MNIVEKKEQFREGFQMDDESVATQPKRSMPTPEPEPPLPESEYVETWPIVVRLKYKPIRGNKNEELKELSFREPTGGDINRYGNPVRVDQNGDIVIDERKMTAIMAVLSGVLTPFLERMDPRDWNSCAYRLRGFFLPDPSAW